MFFTYFVVKPDFETAKIQKNGIDTVVFGQNIKDVGDL